MRRIWETAARYFCNCESVSVKFHCWPWGNKTNNCLFKSEEGHLNLGSARAPASPSGPSPALQVAPEIKAHGFQ